MPNTDRRQSRRSYLKATGTVATLGTTGLAGCTLFGGGDGDGGGTITIAATIPNSGQFSSLGQAVERGYRLGVSAMNEQLDSEVELLVEDDESDAELVRENLQQMVSNNQVDMIWGSFSSLLVTAGSAERLSLDTGADVVVSFKATATRGHPAEE